VRLIFKANMFCSGLFYAFLLTAIANTATACVSDAPTPNFEAMLEAEQVFLQSKSTLERVNAYVTLLRTGEPNLRGAVIRMGLERLEDENIRGAALHCKFITSSIMTVNSMPLADANDAMPDMTDSARDHVIEGRTYSLRFFYTDATKGCASINRHSDDECPASYSAVVSGLSVSFQNDRNLFGRFELNDQNLLVGEIGIWNGSRHDVLPATAALD